MIIRLVLLLTLASLPALASPLPKAPHVYVAGSAEVRIQPDTLAISLGISATDPQVAAAKAKVDERTRKLLSECRRLGIPDDDISAASLRIGPHYEYRSSERKLVGTRVDREVEVILRNLERYSELVQAIVASEVGEIRSMEPSSSKGAKTLDQVQQMALADARARAERLAAASGQKLGDAWSISEFDQRWEERFELRPARGIGVPRQEIQALGAEFREGPEPFEPGTIVATATVYVVYLLED